MSIEEKYAALHELHRLQLEPLLAALPEDLHKQIITDYVEAIYFRQELLKESDRGLALLAVGKLDVKLQNSLQHCMVGSKTDFREIFSNNGPLSTFSSRIKIAYAIGLITKKLSIEIHAMREIRNKFAHHDTPIDFDNEEIDKICRKLTFIPKDNSNRQTFITTTMLMLSVLNNLTLNIKPFKEKNEIYTSDALKKMAIDVKNSIEVYKTMLEDTSFTL